MTNSNYICILEAANEAELHLFIDRAIKKNILYSIFREPDLNDAITAIALAPGNNSKKICSRLKLAGGLDNK